ncbi:unnamed protein product [Allacma fusca]|uniref:Uncharacterized protein n=1 Tax=Allacma fusca TaxID=39272 RepID=A0A8J2NZJ6_9HEXA|nr:unnamed protein product [Allacma fusca]
MKPSFHSDFLRFNIALIFLSLDFSSGKLVILLNEGDNTWGEHFETGLDGFSEERIDRRRIFYTNETHGWPEVCQQISNGVTAVVDFTYADYDEKIPKQFFLDKEIPYFKVIVPTNVLIQGSDAMLQSKRASNGFLIFHSANDLDRGIHVILGNTLIRYAFLNANTMSGLIREKFDYRIPSAVVLFGIQEDFTNFISSKIEIVRDKNEWVFMYNKFARGVSTLNITFPYIQASFDAESCCRLQNSPASQESQITCPECKEEPTNEFSRKLGHIFMDALSSLDFKSKSTDVSCTSTSGGKGKPDFRTQLISALKEKAQSIFEIMDDYKITSTAEVSFTQINPSGPNDVVGQFSIPKGFIKDERFAFRPRPAFFRIGIVDFPPWTFKEDGKWKGYCIDLAEGIAKQMNFTYDLVESNGFGRRNNITGRWDGLTGDLIHGKVDIAVAAYIMTSEREEFIDFVSPYYEQSGLIITMKKPDANNSLFKFMTVLRTEVWLSIAGATISTGLMLWFLDKFSPYSAQNNPHKYKTFRKFTLKESFWFALTSFTPQGGGEPPKAFSGRTLVAAYWIFVVLMLATFTANLAAFLTVERMQSPIRNLEHLAAQSSVKYSVAKNSTALNFFKNMAHAEETLYQMWRNLTLSAPSSAKEYIVWEYPIREMYIHIYSVIKKSDPVENYTQGLERAMNDQYFAFIHDAAQTRYNVYRNCTLTLIGEAFAEAPYAIAVAQGNPLQDNLSMAILQLQTARFFEQLSGTYWTSNCPTLGEGESDGISLESLGGVFIATIIGLGIAFISLAIEVFTTARNRRKAKIEADNMIKPNFVGPLDFYGASKKSEAFRRGNFLPEVIN